VTKTARVKTYGQCSGVIGRYTDSSSGRKGLHRVSADLIARPGQCWGRRHWRSRRDRHVTDWAGPSIRDAVVMPEWCVGMVIAGPATVEAERTALHGSQCSSGSVVE
jgi:hypothetical protein